MLYCYTHEQVYLNSSFQGNLRRGRFGPGLDLIPSLEIPLTVLKYTK